MIETINKIKQYHAQGRLYSSIMRVKVMPLVYALRYLHDPQARHIELWCPDYAQPEDSPEEKALVARLFEAFKKMKADQQHRDYARFRPSSLWQKNLDVSYHPLKDSIENNDIDTFHFFLSNFGAWKTETGIESNRFIRENMGFFRRRYLRNVVFDRLWEYWRWYHGGRHDISRLTYPRHGNQMGCIIDGQFCGIGSFSSDIYCPILAGLIADRKRPVLADLGAGYGKFDYFILRDLKNALFIDFDLPEILTLASYYMMKTWPEKRTLLYGEGDLNVDSMRDYDMMFLPSFCIDELPPQSVDLFINKNSLGEMDADAAHYFVTRICESTHYFFHMNHEMIQEHFSGGKRGLLGCEYPVPEEMFKTVQRYPEINHMLYTGRFDKTIDIFFYLYERRAEPFKRA